MQLAIASGKGGTGKTTIAVALSLIADCPVTYLDCDVEEPNGAIFLKPHFTEEQKVNVLIPEFDPTRCTCCGECARFCQFNALSIAKKPLLFEELCHSCGGCARVCPEGAITEIEREIGKVQVGRTDRVRVVQGTLNVGKVLSPVLIRAVRTHSTPDSLTIIDCPPGMACPLTAAIDGVDFVLLVSEPTSFGLHDLKLTIETIQSQKIQFAVLVNRANIGDNHLVDWCHSQEIPILLEILEQRSLAEAGSRGQHLLTACSELQPQLKEVLYRIEELNKEHST